MIEDPPLLTIRKNFDRVPKEAIAELDGAQTGHIVDAMRGRGAMDGAIKAVDPNRASFIGSAFPCETGPSDNLAIMAAVRWRRKAMSSSPPRTLSIARRFAGTSSPCWRRTRVARGSSSMAWRGT